MYKPGDDVTIKQNGLPGKVVLTQDLGTSIGVKYVTKAGEIKMQIFSLEELENGKPAELLTEG